uniref:Homeobox domain-containing protein n=1 Tax=Panagrellus redivivus TaxID=6233 RepID=A0A7E4VDQ1_PANRE
MSYSPPKTPVIDQDQSLRDPNEPPYQKPSPLNTPVPSPGTAPSASTYTVPSLEECFADLDAESGTVNSFAAGPHPKSFYSFNGSTHNSLNGSFLSSIHGGSNQNSFDENIRRLPQAGGLNSVDNGQDLDENGDDADAISELNFSNNPSLRMSSPVALHEEVDRGSDDYRSSLAADFLDTFRPDREHWSNNADLSKNPFYCLMGLNEEFKPTATMSSSKRTSKDPSAKRFIKKPIRSAETTIAKANIEMKSLSNHAGPLENGRVMADEAFDRLWEERRQGFSLTFQASLSPLPTDNQMKVIADELGLPLDRVMGYFNRRKYRANGKYRKTYCEVCRVVATDPSHAFDRSHFARMRESYNLQASNIQSSHPL